MKDLRVRMLKYLVCILCGIDGMSLQTVNAASFNCSKASNVVESLICKDASLSKKDSQLASLYKKALKDLPRSMQRDLRDEQREWLTARDSCNDRECLELLYSKRIYDLKHFY